MRLSEPFETRRLKFRLLTMDDLASVHRQFSDQEMCRYFSEPPCTLDEAKGIIEHYQEPEGKGHLRYGLFDLATGAFIGTCGYHYWDRDRKQVEIGYDIWKHYWQQGYASEALPVLIRLCFEHLGVDCVYVLVDPGNAASIATVAKFGFKPCPLCRKPDVVSQICLRLMRSEWEAGQHETYSSGMK
ncbi:MAG: GNAT family N-acetyltransferase [Bacillota bacterium]